MTTRAQVAFDLIMSRFHDQVAKLSGPEYREVMEEIMERMKEHTECLNQEEADETR